MSCCSNAYVYLSEGNYIPEAENNNYNDKINNIGNSKNNGNNNDNDKNNNIDNSNNNNDNNNDDMFILHNTPLVNQKFTEETVLSINTLVRYTRL